MTDKLEKSPYQQMVEGNHWIGVFRDGKALAFDGGVYKPPEHPDRRIAQERRLRGVWDRRRRDSIVA